MFDIAICGNVEDEIAVFYSSGAFAGIICKNKDAKLSYGFVVPFDCNKIVHHRIIIIGSAISYELFLVHGFIIDFIHQHLPLTGMLFVLLALIFSLLAAAILKLIVQCIERIKAGVCF